MFQIYAQGEEGLPQRGNASGVHRKIQPGDGQVERIDGVLSQLLVFVFKILPHSPNVVNSLWCTFKFLGLVRVLNL